MAEIGLDLSHEYPKPLTAGTVQAADVVITMGCGDACRQVSAWTPYALFATRSAGKSSSCSRS